MLAAHLAGTGGRASQAGAASQMGGNADQGDNMLSNDGNPGSSAGAQSERLKVEDALNYLDQVKYKFGNQPQIYNDFLDIMKEFKSQSIDTPGVIARVSNLFRGHPELIVGFNTFLPPGYKIEIQSNDQLTMGLSGGAGYIVTTVQTAPPGPGGHPGGQISTVIQSHNMPLATAQRPAISNVNSNHGRISPIQASPISTGNNYDGPSSTFSHSSYSPFVEQNIQMQRFPSLQSQPVEFNHAINYVNKIKIRFQGQPDKYKQFLEILHTYQKEQRTIKEGQPLPAKHLTEHEVYSQVAKLFENQEDLLSEFGQFLPDATNHQNTSAIDQAKKTVKMTREFQPVQNTKPAGPPPPAKRPTLQPAAERKKSKPVVAPHSTKDISLVEAGRYGTLNEFAFFDKVRHALQHQDVYDNFLRCLVLFNDEVISRSELLMLVNPFLGKTPELHNWFKDFVGVKHQEPGFPYNDPVVSVAHKNENKLTEEQIIDIDFSTCKRLGASYCAMPKNNAPPKCSGRITLPLCKEVLNDVWVSFPAWSEDTTFSSSRKTTFEECIYRVEDERFELDAVIETNGATIRIFELLIKKMARLSPEELSEFQLDDCLGGTSPTIHQRAIRRLYGDKALEIIEGLKKQPQVAVPLVLRRLKAKEEEWRDAQKQFNKSWREQTEKYYLKSLDLQGITFKQNDVRALRSKALLLEIDTLFDERQEKLISNPAAALLGPHLTLLYRDRTVLDDACLLLLHHVRRQSGIGKEDKRRIKQLLKHLLADLFQHARMDLSDDEDECRGLPEDIQEGHKSPDDFLNTVSKTKRNGKRGNGGNSKASAAKRDVEDADSSKTEDSRNNLSVDDHGSTDPAGPSSTTAVWTELTQRKKLSTAQESQESRRTIAKRELKLLLNDAKSHELTNLGTTSLRDKATREYLNAISKDDGSCATAVPPQPVKRRASRRMSQHAGDSSTSQNETTHRQVQPRVISIPNPDEDEAYALFFANSTWYSFLRLHQILCERLSKIYERSVILVQEEAKEDNSAAFILKMKSRSEVEVEDYYPTFLDMIRNLLDGNIDGTLYEDTLREMFGIHAYIAYTMDKVVSNAVRQLQQLVTDAVSQKCSELYHEASKRGGTGGFYSTMSQRVSQELWYQKKAEQVCTEENCIKTMIFKKHCRMTMELLETEEPAPCDVEQKAKYTAYVSKFLKPDRTIPENLRVLMGDKPVFLGRNILNWKKKNLLEWISDNNKRGSGKLTVQPLIIKEEPMDLDVKIENEEDVVITKLKEAPHEGIVVKKEDAPTMEVDNIEEAGECISIVKGEQRFPVTIKMEDEEIDQSMDHLIVKTVGKSQPDRQMELVVQENLECHVDISSMKLVYLALSEDCIYLMGSLQRARRAHKRITLTKAKKFNKFHNAWLQSNVTPSQISECENFLQDTKSTPPRIMSIPWGNEDEVPYRAYVKYVMFKKPKAGQAIALPGGGDKH